MKVGDTFRVFEVVNPEDYEEDKGLTGIESKYYERCKYPHLLIINNNSNPILNYFESHELKQVCTIRIKSLKNGK